LQTLIGLAFRAKSCDAFAEADACLASPFSTHSSNCLSETRLNAPALDLNAASALSASVSAILAVSCRTRRTDSGSRAFPFCAKNFGVARRKAISTALP
jgi:hypothetical protein